MENITKVNISELHPFPNHPFQVRDDDAMKETVESVQEIIETYDMSESTFYRRMREYNAGRGKRK